MAKNLTLVRQEIAQNALQREWLPHPPQFTPVRSYPARNRHKQAASGSARGFSIAGQVENSAIGAGIGIAAAASWSAYFGVEAAAGSFAGPVGLIAGAIYDLFSFFDSLFGGGPSLPPNYYVYEHRLRHNRHPLYDDVIGVSDDLVPTQGSEAPVAKGCYASPDDAAKAAVGPANSLSLQTGNEAGGAIVPSDSGFGFTGPSLLGTTGGYLQLPPGYVGSYHTHPSSDVPEQPSELDKDYAKFSKAPVYIITPSGEIIKITPNGPSAPLSRTAPEPCK